MYSCGSTRFSCFILFLASLLLISCSRPENKKQRPSFEKILGLQFIEVRRAFDSGLSFNDQGFQQEPAWKLYFLSEDSVMIFNPVEKVYFHYPIYHDHDSVFNIAREWLRVKKIDKDSLIFQLLYVEGKKVSREMSNVTMKFYSHSYLTKVLKQDPEILKRPTRADTLFIKRKAEIANRNPDSCFAARNPVGMKSTIKEIIVSKDELREDPYNLLGVTQADKYLKPEYSITVNKSYKEFFHTFTVVVDRNGKMHVGKFITSPEFVDSRKRVLKGIIETYLERFIVITPGSTLGIPHASEITLHVRGVL